MVPTLIRRPLNPVADATENASSTPATPPLKPRGQRFQAGNKQECLSSGNPAPAALRFRARAARPPYTSCSLVPLMVSPFRDRGIDT